MTKKVIYCAAPKCRKHVSEEFTFCSKHAAPVVEDVIISTSTLCPTCNKYTMHDGVCLTCTPVVGGDSLNKEDMSVLMDKFLDHAASSIGAGKGFFDGLFGSTGDTVVSPDKGTDKGFFTSAKTIGATAWSLIKKGTDKVHAFLKKHVAQISVGVTSMLVGLPLATSFVSWAAIAAAIGGGIMLVFHLIRAKGDIKRLAWADYMNDVVGTVAASGVAMLLMTASVFWPLFLMQDLVEMGYLFNSTKA